MCTCVFMQFSLRFCTLQEIPQFLKRRNWQHFKNHHGLVQGSVLFNSRLAFLRFSDSANLILLSYHCLFNWWFIYLKYFYILIMAAQWIVYFKSMHCLCCIPHLSNFYWNNVGFSRIWRCQFTLLSMNYNEDKWFQVTPYCFLKSGKNTSSYLKICPSIFRNRMKLTLCIE